MRSRTRRRINSFALLAMAANVDLAHKPSEPMKSSSLGSGTSHARSGWPVLIGRLTGAAEKREVDIAGPDENDLPSRHAAI